MIFPVKVVKQVNYFKTKEIPLKKKLPQDLKNAARIAIVSSIKHHKNLGGIVKETIKGYLERDGWEVNDEFISKVYEYLMAHKYLGIRSDMKGAGTQVTSEGVLFAEKENYFKSLLGEFLKPQTIVGFICGIAVALLGVFLSR